MFQFVSNQTIIRSLLEELIVQVSSVRYLFADSIGFRVYQGSGIQLYNFAAGFYQEKGIFKNISQKLEAQGLIMRGRREKEPFLSYLQQRWPIYSRLISLMFFCYFQK